MAQFTKQEIESLDIINDFGPFAIVSGNSSFLLDGLDIINDFGPIWGISGIGTTPSSFDTSRMFLIF